MAEPVEAPARKRIKELEVMVSEVRAETPDTVTLVLFTGNDRLDYRPGHFCTIDPHQFPELERFIAYFEDVKGKKEPPRAYSLSSAPHEKYVAITVKEEPYVPGVTRYPPLLSPLLVKGLAPGRHMVITGFTGPYVVPEDVEQRTNHLVHLVAGSGSVPNFSILKHSLHLGQKLRHTFLFSNKTAADVCFRKELDALERQYPSQVRVFHLLTREKDEAAFGPRVRKGRLSLELLREVVPEPTACMAFVCGPGITPWEKRAAREKGEQPAPRFLETALELLGQLGVPKDRVNYESYG